MTTVSQFIRDVGTLPDADLRSYLVSHDPEQDATAHLAMATAAVDELLRRERDRCAGECASVAAETYSDRDEIAIECEQRIRGLQ
jgi:hypothetical protein